MDLSDTTFEDAGNPLDVVEHLAEMSEWSLERPGEDEVTIAISATWCEVALSLTWMENIEVLHVSGALDLKVPKKRQAAVNQLLAMVNARMWLGHFDLWHQDGTLVYRSKPAAAGGRELHDLAVGDARRGRGRGDRAVLPGLSVRRLGRPEPSAGSRPGALRDGRHRVTESGVPFVGASDLPLAGLTVALVGAGRMGGAMLEGWLGSGLAPERVVVVDPSPSEAVEALLAGREVRRALHGTVPDVVVLAVKPQAMDDVLGPLAGAVPEGALVVSVAAGRSARSIEATLGARAIVRAMPNTPALVKRGIAGLWAGEGVTPAQRSQAEDAPRFRRRGRLGRGGGGHRRRHRRLGQRAGLRLPPRRGAG